MTTAFVFAAIFVAKLLSVAGIVGFLVGFHLSKFRSVLLAGIVVGVIDSLVMTGIRLDWPAPISWVMAIVAATVATILSWWFWGRKKPSGPKQV